MDPASLISKTSCVIAQVICVNGEGCVQVSRSVVELGGRGPLLVCVTERANESK